jgi:small multidrug resistance pump
MNFIAYLALAIAGACGAIASVLLTRVAGIPLIPLTSLGAGLRFAAVAVYGLGFLLYGYALRGVAVNVAYPIMVSASVILLFVYTTAGGHPASPRSILGAGLVLAGVALLVRA